MIAHVLVIYMTAEEVFNAKRIERRKRTKNCETKKIPVCCIKLDEEKNLKRPETFTNWKKSGL